MTVTGGYYLMSVIVESVSDNKKKAYWVVIHPRNEKGRPLFLYQVGIVGLLAQPIARGSERTGLLLCSYTTRLLNGYQVERQSLIVPDSKKKYHPGTFKSTNCGYFVIRSFLGRFMWKGTGRFPPPPIFHQGESCNVFPLLSAVWCKVYTSRGATL